MKNIKRAAALFVAAICMLSVVSFARAENGSGWTSPAATSDFIIVGYRVLRVGGQAGRVVKGDSVSIEVTVKNTAVTSKDVDPNFPIDLSRVVDSFSVGAAASATVTSTGDAALEMTLTFPSCVYSGNGKAFRCLIGYRKTGEADTKYEQCEINVAECEEYTAPQPAPSAAPVAIPAPSLRISRSNVPTLTAGEEVSITISFTNVGYAAMEDTLIAISTSDALLIMENASSFPVGTIGPGQTKSITMRFKAAKTVSSEQQTISAEAKFVFFNGEARAQGTASDKMSLLANTTSAETARPDGPQPNIILQKYTFGDGSGQAAAGSEFDLSLEFSNTSTKRKVENVVLTIEPGEGLSLSNSSNTFYYSTIGKEETKNETVKLLALSTAKPGTAEVTLTFKYEYVDNNKRSAVTITQKLSIQLFQPDRFNIEFNALPESVMAGEETTVSLNYMNKGKSNVSNVQVRLEGNVEALGGIQNIGNLEPGKSGSINFVLTPQEAGSTSCNVIIVYEDAGGKEQTKSLAFTLNVEEPVYDPALDGEAIEPAEPESQTGVVWYVAGGAALAAAITAVILIKKKRGSKKSGRKTSYEWKDESEG